MDITIKLYDEDSYRTEFEAVILKAEKEDEEDKYDIILDRTLFFPEAGGQTSDIGFLSFDSNNGEKAEVLHVTIDDEIIHHHVSSKKIPAAGDRVKGMIDFRRRFDNMQQHTGEHIFSGLVHSRFGYDNVGFHLSENICTMDYNGTFTPEQISELELAANESIARDLPVTCYYPDDEELSGIDYRCKKELTGRIRIVHIEETDDCACCAPHVKSTGGVGSLKVVSYEKYKGGMRFTIACGLRALEDYRAKHDICVEVSNLFSTSISEILPQTKKLMSEIGELKQKLHNANITLLLSSAEENAAAGNHFFFTDIDDDGAIRIGVNRLMELTPPESCCGILFGDDEKGYRFIFGSTSGDSNALVKKLREKTNCRGGGKPRMSQGQIFAASAEILELLNEK